MLQTVEAEIKTDGTVTLLEAVDVKTTTRALVTVLENRGEVKEKGNVREILEFLRNNRLPAASRRTPEEMEAQIEENRNSWD